MDSYYKVIISHSAYYLHLTPRRHQQSSDPSKNLLRVGQLPYFPSSPSPRSLGSPKEVAQPTRTYILIELAADSADHWMIGDFAAFNHQ